MHESAKTSYKTWGDDRGLLYMAAREYLSNEQLSLYSEMQTISKDLFNNFSTLFGESVGFPDYSMQDMVDNHLKNKPLAILDSGDIHPLSEYIEKFWSDNRLALEQYSYKQSKIYNPPQGILFDQYISKNKNEIRQHLLENIERYLNIEVDLDH